MQQPNEQRPVIEFEATPCQMCGQMVCVCLTSDQKRIAELEAQLAEIHSVVSPGFFPDVSTVECCKLVKKSEEFFRQQVIEGEKIIDAREDELTEAQKQRDSALALAAMRGDLAKSLFQILNAIYPLDATKVKPEHQGEFEAVHTLIADTKAALSQTDPEKWLAERDKKVKAEGAAEYLKMLAEVDDLLLDGLSRADQRLIRERLSKLELEIRKEAGLL